MIKKRTTVYLEDKVAKMLKLRAVKTNQSISDYINKTMYENMIEEQNDLLDIQKTISEPTVSFEKMLNDLGIQDDVQH